MDVLFKVFGHFSSPLGLRVSAENTVEMLRSRGMDVLRCDVSGDGRACSLAPSAPWGGATVNVFHVNPPTIVGLLERTHPDVVDVARSLNVCVPFWELPHVPGNWLPVLRGMDLVLAPTHFIEQAVLDSDASISTLHFPQTVTVPDDVRPDRQRLGLPADATVFGMSFAAQAVIERKNPWAAIDAFRRAFPQEQDVRLVVRAYDAGNADASPTVRRLAEAAGGDSRILVTSERLGYEDVLALYASYDAFVSLHRSEGLGLGPMESMMVGTPVVATNWSGVLDFMTEENSCLVGYRLVPVEVPADSPYGSVNVDACEMWAEPDWRRELGNRARSDMVVRHAGIMAAPFVDELIVRASRLGDPTFEHAGRAGALTRIRRQGIRRELTDHAKRVVVRALRTAGLKPPAPENEARG